MHTYIYIYIYTHTHTHTIYTYKHIYIYIYIYTEPFACTVSKQHARKQVSDARKAVSEKARKQVSTYSATPSCAITHAQAHAPVPHPCVFYPCDDNNNNNKQIIR